MPGAELDSCPVQSCGNSAQINDSIIEALDARGEKVQDLLEQPFRLVPGSLTNARGGCQGVSGLSLGVRDGGFVGVAGGVPGAVRCSGKDLVNARFQVEQRHLKPPGGKTVVTVQIAEMDEVALWKGEQEPAESVPTYDLVYQPASAGPVPPIPRHLCSRSAWEVDGIGLPGRLERWREPSHHAVLIQGETYKPDATVGWTGASWFNIGCAGAGIAKMRLLGLDPMKSRKASDPVEPGSGKSTAEERQATLKMITAKYCGPASWTRNGARILIRHRDARPEPAVPGISGGERAGPIESRWGERGALCISHLRLWSAGSECAKSSEAELVERIRRECQIPACDETRPCSTAGAETDGATVWRTCTVNHVSHASR